MKEIAYAVAASMIITFLGMQSSSAKIEERLVGIKEATLQIVPRTELEKEMRSTRDIVADIKARVDNLDSKVDKILILLAGKVKING